MRMESSDRSVTLSRPRRAARETIPGATRWSPEGSPEANMSDNVYKVIEVVGTSTTSIEDAIEGAVARAGSTIHDIRWFEVTETRGHVEQGKVAHYQVTLRIGFTLTA
jgi:flavin-binding protein dodecin